MINENIDVPASTSGKQPNRKGFNAKKRGAEKFRTKANEKTYDALKDEIRRFREQEMGYKDDLETIINELTAIRAANIKQMEVPISLQSVDALAAHTTEGLRDRGVVIRNEDTNNLQAVIKLQCKAKICAARQKTAGDEGVTAFVNRTKQHFQKTLKSVAVYINQIGVFDHDGQTYYPKLVQQEPINVNYPTRLFNENHERLYVQPVDNNDVPILVNGYVEQNAIGDRRLEANPHAQIDIGALNLWYISFLDRINIKLRGAIVTIDYNEPFGSAAQIVGRTETIVDGVRRYEAWSCRKMSRNTLVLGGACHFAGSDTGIFHYGAVYENIEITPEAWWRRLQNLNDS